MFFTKISGVQKIEHLVLSRQGVTRNLEKRPYTTMAMSRKPLYQLKPVLSDETIGERIRKFRKAKGLTQVEVSERIGISQTLYSSYERGRLRLSAEMLAQIALVLEASTDEILGLEKVPVQKKVNRSLQRRIKGIEALPPRKRKLLFSNIDIFLKGAMVEEKR